MDVGELWGAADMTSKICNVIVYLRGDPGYSREDAAKDLEKFLEDYMEARLTMAFLKDPTPSENDNLAIEKERRLKQLEEKEERNEQTPS